MDKWIWMTISLCVVVALLLCVLLANRGTERGQGSYQSGALLDASKHPVAESGSVKKAALRDDEMPSPVIAAKAEITEETGVVSPKVRIDDSLDVPDSLAGVMGNSSEANYLSRIKAVHDLGRRLSVREIQALYALLNRKNNEGELTADELNAVKNDVVNVLKDQQVMPENLVHNLMAMYSDRGHDDVWRDYCLQHLGDLYESCAEKEQIAATLWDGTKDDQLSIAGTALIALANNIEGNYIKKEDVSEKALFLSSDPNCGELAKLTALQICAKLGERQVLPVARSLAREAQSVPLRISAIAAVGTLGNSSDREMLGKYAQSSDVRLRKSAESALERLNE